MDIYTCPWPKEIWVSTMDDIPALIPDEKNRTSVAGVLSRFGWQQHEAVILDALNRSGDIDFVQCDECSEWCFCHTTTGHSCNECTPVIPGHMVPSLLSSLLKAVTLLCSEYPRSQWSEYGIDAMISSIASAQGCLVDDVLRQIGEADA